MGCRFLVLGLEPELASQLAPEPPTTTKNQEPRTMIPYRLHQTPLGTLRLCAENGALIGAHFVGQKHDFVLDAGFVELPDDALLRAAGEQIDAYFNHHRRSFELPLAPRGTAFQRMVWDTLASIACGQTLSYGELALRVGKPSGVRAVAAAVGRNPLSIIIPCHRILGRDGSMTGYAGGIERKTALLAIESHR